MQRGVPDDVEQLLAGAPVTAHLATAVDDRPHVAPVWYRYEDGTVKVMTTGQKLENIRKNPRVALSIEKHTDGDPEWMVTLRGTATVVEDPEENEAANRRINRKYGTDPDDWSDNTLVRIDVGSANSQRY